MEDNIRTAETKDAQEIPIVKSNLNIPNFFKRALYCSTFLSLPIEPILEHNLSKYQLNLVLDLDNTMIKCSICNLKVECDFQLSFDGKTYQYKVHMRRKLLNFLKTVKVFSKFQINSFGHQIYVNKVVEVIQKKYKDKFKENLDFEDIKGLDSNSLKYLSNNPGSISKSLNKGLTRNNTLIIDDRTDVWPNDLKDMIIRSLCFDTYQFTLPQLNETVVDEHNQLFQISCFLNDAQSRYVNQLNSDYFKRNNLKDIQEINTSLRSVQSVFNEDIMYYFDQLDIALHNYVKKIVSNQKLNFVSPYENQSELQSPTIFSDMSLKQVDPLKTYFFLVNVKQQNTSDIDRAKQDVIKEGHTKQIFLDQHVVHLMEQLLLQEQKLFKNQIIEIAGDETENQIKSKMELVNKLVKYINDRTYKNV